MLNNIIFLMHNLIKSFIADIYSLIDSIAALYYIKV